MKTLLFVGTKDIAFHNSKRREENSWNSRRVTGSNHGDIHSSACGKVAQRIEDREIFAILSTGIT